MSQGLCKIMYKIAVSNRSQQGTFWRSAVVLSNAHPSPVATTPTSGGLKLRSLRLEDAPALLQLYRATPKYFQVISASIPDEIDVHHEIEAGLADARRTIAFVCSADSDVPLAYLDYKRDYPQPGQVTINLLLVPEQRQSSGLGSRIVQLLEQQLLSSGCSEVLASVYGQNPRAVEFWRRLGFVEDIEARPIVVWYRKRLNDLSSH
jgi:ribosomal protein S18 acetylase RimI-like enzyme